MRRHLALLWEGPLDKTGLPRACKLEDHTEKLAGRYSGWATIFLMFFKFIANI